MNMKSFFLPGVAFAIFFDKEEEYTKGEAPRSELSFDQGSVRHKFFISSSDWDGYIIPHILAAFAQINCLLCRYT
jgi:hypothetical protein